MKSKSAGSGLARLGPLVDGAGWYLLSLPERTLRSATAVTGGLLRELGDVALPARFRRTRLYRTLVDSTLRFLIEQVGEVEGAYPGAERLAENFAARRTAGNGIELAGMLAFRASPVWVLAALADLSGAGRDLVREIGEALKQDGLLDRGAEFTTVDQILDGLERSAGRAAEAVNTPPLDVAGLRQEWNALREEARGLTSIRLPSPERLRQNWNELKAVAASEQRTVFEVSTLVALSALATIPENMLWLARSVRTAARRTGELVAGGLLDHYSGALGEIRRTGYLAYWTRELGPYLKAAAAQFAPGRASLTEKLLRSRE